MGEGRGKGWMARQGKGGRQGLNRETGSVGYQKRRRMKEEGEFARVERGE